MTESVTQHYQWTKPEVTKSASTWGGFLNTDLDSIDALVFANQQGIVPIGAIQMFGGAAAPTNWLLCDGASYVRTPPYDKLFAILSTRFGAVDGSHFNVPNLAQKFPLGAGPNPLGQASGSFSVPIAVGNLPAHAHPIVDVAHNHGVSDPTHAHSIADPTHSHGASQDVHNHTVPNNTVLGSGSGLTNGGASFSLQGNTPTSNAQPAVHINASGTGIGIYGAATGISLAASGTGLSTTQNVGSNTPLSVVPPFVALNFIIRFS